MADPMASHMSSKAGAGPSFSGSIIDGTQELRSWTGGTQADSRKETAPHYGFGSQERSPRRAVGLSPGPIYLPSPRGKMGDGPRYTFRTGGAAAENAGGRRAGAVPGPGEYEAVPGTGELQAFSTSQSAPRYGWGTGGRAKPAIGVSVSPACGEFYELDEAMGPQAMSSKRCASNYSFSHDSRFDPAGRTPGARNPGPGAYKAVNATGVQVRSELTSQPMYGFSRDQRFRPRTGAPTPAAQLTRSSVGTQVQSEKRSKPQFGFGSAQRFPSRPATAANGTPGPGSYNA